MEIGCNMGRASQIWGQNRAKNNPVSDTFTSALSGEIVYLHAWDKGRPPEGEGGRN